MSDLHLHFSPLQQRSGLLVFQKRGSDDIIRTLNLLYCLSCGIVHEAIPGQPSMRQLGLSTSWP